MPSRCNPPFKFLANLFKARLALIWVQYNSKVVIWVTLKYSANEPLQNSTLVINFYVIAWMQKYDKVGWKCNQKRWGRPTRLLHKLHLITNNNNYIHYSIKNRQSRTVRTVYVATLDGNNWLKLFILIGWPWNHVLETCFGHLQSAFCIDWNSLFVLRWEKSLEI